MHRPTPPLAALLGAVVLLASGAVRAENGDGEPDYARTGPYIGIAGTFGAYTGVENDYEEPLDDLTTSVFDQIEPTVPADDDEPCANSATDLDATVDLGDPVTVRTLCQVGQQGGAPVDVDYVLGVNGHVGYRLHRYVAVEAEFEWLPERDIEVPLVADFGTIESWMAGGNVKVFLHPGRIQPFLLAGAGYMHVDAPNLDGISVTVEDPDPVIRPVTVVGAARQEDAGSVAARFGGGLDLYLTPHLVGTLKLTYVLTTGEVADLVDADYLSFGWGFGWRF